MAPAHATSQCTIAEGILLDVVHMFEIEAFAITSMVPLWESCLMVECNSSTGSWCSRCMSWSCLLDLQQS